MDYKLQHIHDPDKNFRVRVCMLVSGVPYPFPGSIQVPCDECEQPIWLDPNQKLPEPEPGTVIHGDVNLCFSCFRFHASIDDEPVTWAGPKPPGFD